MNKRELAEINERFQEIYCGILHGDPYFHDGESIAFSYALDCPEYAELKTKYPIEQIAGKGGDFERALRLTRWLHPKLTHKGDYDNHIPCNALELLEYSLDKPEHGINCLNKAKILVECCLALGIYARRLGLYPNSPYDMDNHVVAEIYDRKRKKWIVLDPTTGGYFSDGLQPLSALEVRERFAAFEPCSIVLTRQSVKDMEKLAKRNLDWNVYYMKNFFFFTADTVSDFGEKGDAAMLLPYDFSVWEWKRQNWQYRLQAAEKCGMHEYAAKLREWIAHVEEYAPRIGSLEMWDAPIDKV